MVFASSNPKVAKVYSPGKIIGVSKGSTIITVKAGDIKKKLRLTVKVPAMKIDINETYLVRYVGDNFQINEKHFQVKQSKH